MYFGPNQHGFLLFSSNFISFICSLHLYRVWQRRLLYIYSKILRDREQVCQFRIPFRFSFYRTKYFKSREVGESTKVIFQLFLTCILILWVSQLLKYVEVFMSTGWMVTKFINFRICHNLSRIDKNVWL